MSNRRAETRAGQGWLNEERPDRLVPILASHSLSLSLPLTALLVSSLLSGLPFTFRSLWAPPYSRVPTRRGGGHE